MTDTLKTRIRKAWHALRGTLEPDVREVERWRVLPGGRTAFVYAVWDWPSRKFYAEPDQALESHPESSVERLPAIVVKGEYFVAHYFSAVKVEPKPRKAKGK